MSGVNGRKRHENAKCIVPAPARRGVRKRVGAIARTENKRNGADRNTQRKRYTTCDTDRDIDTDTDTDAAGPGDESLCATTCAALSTQIG